jgi:carbamoyl-phosphate synthase large subunit
MNILITSAGQRVSLVRAFQYELRSAYPGSKVFTTDMCPHLSAACHISDRYFQVPRVTDDSYMESLLALCRLHRIGMIVPTIDTELPVLAQYKQLFEKEQIQIIISSPALIGICRDKRNTNRFFCQHGIGVPETIDKHHPTFPLFIKPYDGSLSSDTYVIHTADDLQKHHLLNEKLLFMEYFSKQEYDEYTVDMYFDKTGHIRCIVPRKRIFVRAGEINKGMTIKNHLVPFLKQKLGYVEGAAGCLTGQFFVHKETGAITGIEINGRFGGGYPLSYQAGANYPLWLIKEYYQHSSIPYTDDWEDQLLMLRFDDEVIVHAHQYQF